MTQVGNGEKLADRDNFHLPGWKLLNVQREDGSEVFTARLIEQPSQCPQCSSIGPLHRHGKRVVSYLDKPVNGKPCRIRGETQRYRCSQCHCSFALEPVGMCADKRMTNRVLEYIESVSMGEQTFSEIAVLLGCNETTVRNIGTQYAERFLNSYRPPLPAKLGIGSAQIDRVSRLVLVDLEEKLPLDILPSCDVSLLSAWLSRYDSLDVLQEVHVTVGEGITAELLNAFPRRTKIVADVSHLEQLVNVNLSQLRIEERRTAKAKGCRWLASHDLLSMRLSENTPEALGRLKKIPILNNGYMLKELFFAANETHCRATAMQTYDMILQDTPAAVATFFTQFLEHLGGFKDVIVQSAYAETAGHATLKVIAEVLVVNGRGRGYGLESLRARVLNKAHFTREVRKLMRSAPNVITCPAVA